MLQPAQAYLQAGRFHEAQALFRQALAQEPLSVPARVGLARACAGAGDVPSAIAWLSDACRIAPAASEPAVLLAETLVGQRQYAQALPLYRRLYEEGGARDRATLLHYGFCLEHLGDLDGAIAMYRDAVTREPGFFEAHVDLAGVLWRVGDFDGSLAHARAAVGLAPQHPYAVRILGTALLQRNRLDEAEVQLRRALALKPDFALAQVDLAFTLLLAGRLEEGWTWYGKRWNDAARTQRPAFFRPELEWQGPGQSLEGKRLLVYAEQGLGDVLQFARYLPLLQALGATVSAVVQPELVPLLESSFAGVTCARPDRPLACDLHAALLDLPGRFGTTLPTIPAAVPYLRAPADRVAHWREQLAPWPGGRGSASPGAASWARRTTATAPSLWVNGSRCCSCRVSTGSACRRATRVRSRMRASQLGRWWISRRRGATWRTARRCWGSWTWSSRWTRRSPTWPARSASRPGCCCRRTRTSAGCWIATTRPGIPRCGCSAAASGRRGRRKSGV